jgi:hypothetical protein
MSTIRNPVPTKPVLNQPKAEFTRRASRKPRFRVLAGFALTLTALAVAVYFARGPVVQAHARTVAPPPPEVAVSRPLQSDIDTRLQFLGQFSAVERVELSNPCAANQRNGKEC